MGEGTTAGLPAGGGTPDPGSLIRSRPYQRLLVVAAFIGVLVSVASWGFLELVHAIQEWVYVDLPDALGFDAVPAWWPVPVLALAGVLIAVAIERLPGTAGHEPSAGLATGSPTTPIELPGVLLAAIASIALGMVLGPEAPLIAFGTGLTLLVLERARREVPDQAKVVLAAAASFAALATVFGSPIVGAVIIIEAAGLGGPTLPLVLLPGLLAAGIGSLVFIGVGALTGLSTQAYAIEPLTLPAYGTPTVADFLWTLALGAAAAVVTFAIVAAGRRISALVATRRLPLTVLAALAVAGLAAAFALLSDLEPQAVLFSGQEAMDPVVAQAGTLALGTLALLLACKAVAWAISLGAARGGPTFPAIFLGVVGGLLASHLPGLAETAAVGVLVGAAVVSVLRLPLASVVIALLVTQGGARVAPLIILGVVVAYVITQLLDARRPAAEPSATQPHDA